jgi:hypothetical protein
MEQWRNAEVELEGLPREIVCQVAPISAAAESFESHEGAVFILKESNEVKDSHLLILYNLRSLSTS